MLLIAVPEEMTSYLQSDPEMLILFSRWKTKLYEERKSIKGNLGMKISDKDKDDIYKEIEDKTVTEDDET